MIETYFGERLGAFGGAAVVAGVAGEDGKRKETNRGRERGRQGSVEQESYHRHALCAGRMCLLMLMPMLLMLLRVGGEDEGTGTRGKKGKRGKRGERTLTKKGGRLRVRWSAGLASAHRTGGVKGFVQPQHCYERPISDGQIQLYSDTAIQRYSYTLGHAIR